MKVNKNKIWFFTLFTIYINVYQPISIYSQNPDSLNHYLDIAIKNNPVVLQKYAEYQAALERIPQASALPDPELSAGIFLSPMELLMGRQIANLRLMQMFPWFGTLSAARDEMSLMTNATYEAFRDSRLQLIYDVQKMWYQVQSVAREIEISNENLEILSSLERIALSRFKTPATGGISGNGVAGSMSAGTAITSATPPETMQGMGGMQTGNAGTSGQQKGNSMQGGSMGSAPQGSGLADLYRLQSDIIQLENSISLLESQLRTYKVKFNSYLDRPPESTVTLPQVMETTVFAIDTTSALDTLLLHNPMLAMAEYERQSLEAREKMSDRMGYPMIGLGIDYSVIGKSDMSASEMNGKDMLMPMVSVTLPINRKKYSSMKREAELLTNAKALEYNALYNGLISDYYEAVELFEDAGRRISLARKQSALAMQTSDIMIKSFSASGTGLYEILQIRRQLIDYEIKEITAIKDYNTAVAWIRRLGY